MNRLKKTDTIIIYGSGSSLKDLSINDLEFLKKFDSISFNKFIKNKIPLTFYIAGEGLLFLLYKIDTTDNILEKNIFEQEYQDCLILLKQLYNETNILLVKNLIHNMCFLNNYTKKLNEDLKDMKNIIPITLYSNTTTIININNINNYIIEHLGCGLNSCIYFALALKYKKIIFVGVDLYNTKYSYNIDVDKLYNSTIDKNVIHTTYDNILNVINANKNKIHFTVYNKNSLLAKTIDLYDYE